jgi:outer membrane receptor for ferrienterochelin and colicins
MRDHLNQFVIAAILVSISITTCMAQSRTISGKVFDYSTKGPLSGVNVNIKDVTKSSVTNNEGYYEINVPENISVIEFADFKEKKISELKKISENEINIYLSDFSEYEIYSLSLEELMKIKVEVASKYSEPLNEAPAVVSVVTADEIESYGATSLYDVLERIPGMIVYRSGDSPARIALRGDLNITHYLFMVNNRPTREILKDGAYTEILAMFPISSIERIEVISGPGSILYGSNAITGVINIVTKREKEFLSATVSGGSPSAKTASASGAAKIGKGMFCGGINYKDTYWQQNFINELGTPNLENMREEGLGTDLSYNLGGWSVNTSLILWRNFLLDSRWDGDYGDFIRHFIDVGYVHPFSSKIKTSINASNTYSYFDALPRRQRRSSNNVLLEITNYYNSGKKLNAIVGGVIDEGSGIEERLVNDTIIPSFPWYKSTHYSVYSQFDYKLIKTVKVIGGFQLHKYSVYKPKFVPRFGLVFTPVDKLFIKLLYAEAYRTPNASELAINDPHLLGNPDLVPENEQTLDLEFIYNQKKLRTALSLFMYKQSDIIATRIYGNLDVYKNVNQFSAKGVNIEVKYYPASRLNIVGSASYQTNLLNDSIENTSTAAITAKLGISYAFNFGLSFGFFNIYNSKPPDLLWRNPQIKIVNPVPDAFNLLSANVNYNLSKIFNTANTNIILNFRVENLLNEEIYTNEVRSARINSIPGKPGRRIYLGAKVNF